MEEKTSIGSIIATIIIIALIILGGLYFWGKRIEEAQTMQTFTVATTTETTVVNQNETTSTSSPTISTSTSTSKK
jgi:uncharacterized protein YxeA